MYYFIKIHWLVLILLFFKTYLSCKIWIRRQKLTLASAQPKSVHLPFFYVQKPFAMFGLTAVSRVTQYLDEKSAQLHTPVASFVLCKWRNLFFFTFDECSFDTVVINTSLISSVLIVTMNYIENSKCFIKF